MSKTFQEIEISNGSWIKEQSDRINIFNEKKLIDFSEDTFRLFDAMIFISYNASPLMHASEFLKQSLDYKDYWEKAIDYIISEINFKEYNNKSKEGIESFVLLWNIIAKKNLSLNEINNLEISMVFQLNKDEIKFSEKEIYGIIYSQVNNALGKYIREQTDHLNAFLKDEFKVNMDRTRINYDDKKKNLENIFEVKYKKIIPNKIKEIKTNIKFNFGVKNYITNKKYYDFITFLSCLGSYVNEYKSFKIPGSIQYFTKELFGFKRELENWLKANLVIIKIIYLSGEMFWANIDAFSLNFRNIIYKDVSNRNWAINFSIIKSNHNRLDNKYKIYFNNIRNLNDYFALKYKNNRYGIKYEKIKNLYEKIICVFSFVDSEYIIFIL